MAATLSSRRGVYTRDAAGNAVWTPAGSTAAPTAASMADAGLLRSSVADILGLRAQATQDEAAAKAEETTARGLSLEAEGYSAVGGIAAENAGLAGIAGNIRELQTARSVRRTIGAQRAAIASAGFGNAGTSLDLLRSSMQEGMLSSQLIRTQTALNQGGYLQEGAAAEAQAGGARLASESALELAKVRRSAGALATANAAAQTDALSAYIASSQNGAALTPAQMLALGALAADPTVAGSFVVPGAGGGVPVGVRRERDYGSPEDIAVNGPRYQISSSYLNNPAGPAPSGFASPPYVDTWQQVVR